MCHRQLGLWSGFRWVRGPFLVFPPRAAAIALVGLGTVMLLATSSRAQQPAEASGNADALFPRQRVQYPPLPFRALIVHWEAPLGDREAWEKLLSNWSRIGYTALVFWVDCEVGSNGSHQLIRFQESPEARELPPDRVEENIKNCNWVFTRARALGLSTYLYTGAVIYTKAFARAHGLDRGLPASPSVSVEQHDGPEGWMNHGVRNELTRAYTAAVYEELSRLYPNLTGFYGVQGEALPGRRSTWFSEAVVPGLKRSGRKPHYIAHQWQIPLVDYLRDIAPAKVYDNTWLALHAYNSEQSTDAEPYAFINYWAKSVGLPTVFAFYPANIQNLPFNSPQFAWEIANEMKRVPNARGFVQFEFVGRKLSPLFSQALVYYAAHGEPYSDQRWLDILAEQYGDRQAGRHMLNAFNVSGRIIPETDALVYCPHDNWRRELNMPYYFFTLDFAPFSHLTARVRGEPLVPVWNYARHVARNAAQFKDNNGTCPDRIVEGAYDTFRQIAVWRTEGGSTFDVIPPVHMKKIRAMGEQALAQADLALPLVKKNQQHAKSMREYMKGYQLLSAFYERKVAAATAAQIYFYSRNPAHRVEAEKLADEALRFYLQVAEFLQKVLDPIARELQGRALLDAGRDIPKLIEEEKRDREKLAEIFQWP